MNLLEQRCQGAGVSAMAESDVRRHLSQVSGWQLIGGAIEKTFRFRDDLETLAFVNALGWMSHVEDHHAELRVTYDHCVVRFNTHSVGGISLNDFICAAKADALVAFAA
ncbi:4a-hydroxytetrahydrobiopterin dehydratase [Piscinibacter koreensis]|uniref:4a-hydroxytetrahydrobiopterin dehydratase n=1 Tax=Piscinibacter koreensis TaxID=2742824 RepID=A0A7Y6TXJ5_9BURK|nr:4a-hydroxytetrahydrobiopterin dehydratase [Schlegelella koreensis]NUZ07116.1 4a-hydroxytetrahydrobiopterin dehydratase [Schlegelella koreensis]